MWEHTTSNNSHQSLFGDVSCTPMVLIYFGGYEILSVLFFKFITSNTKVDLMDTDPLAMTAES